MLKFKVTEFIIDNVNIDAYDLVCHLIDSDNMRIRPLDTDPNRVKRNIVGRLYIHIKNETQMNYWNSKIGKEFTIDLKFNN
jgi:hypothetical protein